MFATKVLFTVLLSFSTFVYAGEAADAGVGAAPQEAKVQLKNSFKYKELKVGYDQSILTVVAETNPTTGFDWYVKNYDESAVKVLPSAYESTVKDEIVSGASSIGTYQVEILKAGTTVFDFHYMRNWQGGEEAELYRFTVTADQNKVITDAKVEFISR